MPKRTDIKSILVIGAGPIIIGQACEFDYSGTQACKALKEEGYKVILVNSNPATIMTDKDIADVTYIEPITTEFIEQIIKKEMPDAVLPTVGGQTALNAALSLAKAGILEKYNVKLIGASIESIEKAENRQKFKEAMHKIGLQCPRNTTVYSIEEAEKALDYVGLPAIIRSSFTLGGAGGGIAYTKEEYIQIISNALEGSKSGILIDESIIGWKEYEMEAIRDSADNCIIICSIENIDPMGVHTGDSITVAPALTLTDKEYQKMRNATIAVLREIGVDTGGSNVQFAINPKDGRMLVIEMNPRVSRSSALASKATGFPIAKVAAKLAVGYILSEIVNDATRTTPESFEPVMDYIVTKIPRFTFEKFSADNRLLSTAMKSVGEVMAIGRSFAESIQKALRSLEYGLDGFNEQLVGLTAEDIKEKLKYFYPERILYIADAIRSGISLEEINEITSYDMWFLREIENIVLLENKIKHAAKNCSYEEMLEFKINGFSDSRIAYLWSSTEEYVRNYRKSLEILPISKKIDTCSAEFQSFAQYYYNCYEYNDNCCESYPSNEKKVIILGSGPNRIGQGIEFDYTCVHAAYAMKKEGHQAIMINCNPETVSTDYDTASKLYFEPITYETVMDIIEKESSNGEIIGVNLQFGGQTPLKLSKKLKNIEILGTSAESIDIAEDRKLFSEMISNLGIIQPKNFTCTTREEVISYTSKIGFPVMLRPSYVLGGRAMAIIENDKDLYDYLDSNESFFADGPLLVDEYIAGAKELDVDAICDSKDVYIAGIMEHIEEAGIHSGDSACVIPPYSLKQEVISEVIEITKKIALHLQIRGLVNIQYVVKESKVYVIEVNPRASRTVPFIAKATGVNVAEIASKVMIGYKLSDLIDLNHDCIKLDKYYVKQPVFPFARFNNVDISLGPEMKSTGETMGSDIKFAAAYIKAKIGAGDKIPQSGNVLISVKDLDKKYIVPIANELINLGFKIFATSGTSKYLTENGIENIRVNKVSEGGHHIVNMMKNDEIQFIINTTKVKSYVDDNINIRKTAMAKKVPYSLTIGSTQAMLEAISYLGSVQ